MEKQTELKAEAIYVSIVRQEILQVEAEGSVRERVGTGVLSMSEDSAVPC